jgi:hypothetical protein
MLFKQSPCKSFFDAKQQKFKFKGFSLAFQNSTGVPIDTKLGELNYDSIPPALNDQLRS